MFPPSVQAAVFRRTFHVRAGDVSETLNADHPWANFTY